MTGFAKRLITGLMLAAMLPLTPTFAQSPFGDWRDDAPGVTHRITPSDLPAPNMAASVSNAPEIEHQAAPLHVPPGFTVARFAEGLVEPRIITVAPNGDIFVAESGADRVRVFRAADGAAQPQRSEIFAQGFGRPFGIAFYPNGPDPQYVYIAGNNAVQRIAYRNGDMVARSKPQTVVSRISATSFYHWTRDVAFSLDSKTMFISVGSGSNDAEELGPSPPTSAAAVGAPWGALWGDEADRADVLAFDPTGRNRQFFATGLRNCSGLAVQPQTGDLWCATNERDGLGNNLPPDYVTRVRQGGFYGWPWFYIGAHQDPRHPNERPDLASRVSLPDVLIQPHSAPLGMTFYTGRGVASFPLDYRGDAFVALHGSWNRAARTGYKVIRIHLHDGVPDGTYQDFMTGFVLSDTAVWGRPVGVGVAHDGALLVSDDAGGTLWRIAYARR
jgi:glucose/arabinose dehydrogenase